MMESKKNLNLLLEKFNLALNFQIDDALPETDKISKEDVVQLFGRHKFFITILNGQFNSELSALPPNVQIYTLSQADDLGLDSNFHSHVSQSNPNAYTEASLIKNGLIIGVEKGGAEDILYVNHLSSHEHSCFNELRQVYVFKEHCSIELVEQFACMNHFRAPQFNNIISEFVCEKNSSVKISRIGSMSNHVDSKNICRSFVKLFEKSNFSIFDFTVNSAWSNNNFNVLLSESLASCNLYSISCLNGNQRVENNIHVHHGASDCYSRQIYKGVFDDEAFGSFDSCVLVSKKAQKTIAIQQNNSIILSDYALVKSNPQLEIFADDVECSHGSTVGQIDEKALFYLRSRGVNLRLAYNILLKAFLSDVIEKITNPVIKDAVLSDLDKKLSLRK